MIVNQMNMIGSDDEDDDDSDNTEILVTDKSCYCCFY